MKPTLVLVVLLLATTAFTQTPDQHAQQPGGRRARIVKLPQAEYDMVQSEIEDLAKAWNAGDVPGMSAHMADAVQFITPTGALISGKKGLDQRHAEIMKKYFAGSRQTMTVRQTTFVRPRVGFCDVEVEITHYRSLPPGIPGRAGQPLRLMTRYLLTKDGRDWTIAAAQSTVLHESLPKK